MHARWGTRVQFLDVLIRQAHPGPAVPHYQSESEKRADAAQFVREEHIPYPVLVDDLAGTVHQVYGGLADPIYIIDTEGRVVYYNMWSYAPALHEAIETLLARGGRGVVKEGVNRAVYPLPSLVDGWRGLRKGLPQSYLDMEAAAPGLVDLTFVAHKLRPLLAPLALRATPLPPPVRYALLLAFLALPVWLLRRRERTVAPGPVRSAIPG